MAKNDYLARQRALIRSAADAGEQTGIQMMWDYMTIALRDPEVVGKDIFGDKRLRRLLNRIQELRHEFQPAFIDGPEMDYYQEKLDGCIREVWSEEDFFPFRERYPSIQTFGYDKPRKAWK